MYTSRLFGTSIAKQIYWISKPTSVMQKQAVKCPII